MSCALRTLLRPQPATASPTGVSLGRQEHKLSALGGLKDQVFQKEFLFAICNASRNPNQSCLVNVVVKQP